VSKAEELCGFIRDTKYCKMKAAAMEYTRNLYGRYKKLYRNLVEYISDNGHLEDRKGNG
jgi:hypothetical protein